jgi:hypothetical protein
MDSTRTPPRPCTLGRSPSTRGYCASALAESTTALRAEMHRTSSSSYRPEPSGLSIVSFRGLLLAVQRSPKLQRLDGARCADRRVTEGNEAASNRASSARTFGSLLVSRSSTRMPWTTACRIVIALIHEQLFGAICCQHDSGSRPQISRRYECGAAVTAV